MAPQQKDSFLRNFEMPVGILVDISAGILPGISPNNPLEIAPMIPLGISSGFL